MLAIFKQYALAVLLFVAVVTVFVSYVARQQLSDFSQQQTALAQQASRHVRDIVTLTLASQRQAVKHFAQLHAQLISKLAASVDDAGLYDELDLLLGAYFPDMHSFTLADSRGNLLLGGSADELLEACVQNIQMYSVDSNKVDAGLVLHDGDDGSHYDMLSKLFMQDSRSIVLFISFKPDSFVQTLKVVEPENHEMYIVRDDTQSIEMSRQGAKPVLSGDTTLAPSALARLRARVPIENTRWDVVDIAAESLLSAVYSTVVTRASLIWLMFCVIGLLALLHSARVEKRRLLTEQKLKAHEAELEQIVRERTDALTKANERLQHLSLSDGLTGIANRRHFDAILNREIGRANRDNKPLSLLLFDIDFFKNYNDSAGHLAGDDCLRKIARAVDGEFKRGGDLTARYGGEEFAIILPGSDAEEMQKQAERVREIVWQLNIPHPDSSVAQRVTVSVGGSTLRGDQYKTGNELIDEADEALFQAKSGGRNQYRIYAT